MQQRKSPVGRQILWIISAMVLCLVVPLWLHDVTGGGDNPRSPWWSLAIIVVSGAAYAGVLAGRRRQLFGMVLWLFTYLFMGMAPYVQYRLDLLPSTVGRADEAFFPAAGILVLICCLAVLVGSFLAANKPVTHQLKHSAVDPRKANLLTLAAFAVFAYYGNAVGFGSFILSRTEFSAVRSEVWADSAASSLLTGALHMMLLVGFIAQMSVRSQAKSARIKAPVILPLLNGLVLLYVVNPIGSSRTLVGTVLLAMLAAFGTYATVQRFRVMAVAAPVGMLTLFPIADSFRHSASASVESVGPVDALTSGDFDAFAQLATTLEFVADAGLTYGMQLLGVLLLWVPRSVWPGKPLDTGIVLGEYKGYGFTNLSSPIWSELYINFGTIGTILGMGLLSYFFRRWDIKTDVYLRTSRIPPVAVCAISFYLLLVLRGSLLNAASYLLVIVLASWFVTRKPPKGPSASRTTSAPDTRVGAAPPGYLRR